MPAARPHIVLMSQEVWPLVPGGGIGRYVRDASRVLARVADVTILTPERWRPAHDALVAAGESPAAPGVTFAWAPDPPDDVAPFRSWFHASAAGFLDGLRAVARERPVDLVEYDDFRGIGAMVAHAVRGGDPLLAGVRTVARQDTAWEITELLDGLELESPGARWLAALEREALRDADVLVSAAPAAREAYRRYYGAAALPTRAEIVRRPNPDVPVEPPARPSPAADGVRLLYVGRLQECKGVTSLVRAVRAHPDADVRLTLVGGDTASGPAGTSMRAHLELLADGDDRIAFHDRVAPERLARIYGEHHVVVMPSRFESHGYVAREALAQDRPVVVTPVGGLADVAVEGRTGWCADDVTDGALLRTLERVVGDRDALDRMIADRRPSATLASWGDDDAFAAAYLELAGGGGMRAGGADQEDATAASNGAAAVPDGAAADDADAAAPDGVAATVDAAGTATASAAGGGGVTAVVRVPTRGARLRATLDALEAQLTGRPEIVAVVDDLAVLRAEDLERIDEAVVAPRGDWPAGRRRALAARAGDGPVLLLDAGDTVTPEFVARAGEVLVHGGVPYVSAWGTGRGPGNTPLGNGAAAVVGQAGVAASVTLATATAAAVLARADLERSFVELAALGRHGLVLPERLVGRVRRPLDEPSAPAPLPRAPASAAFVAG